MLADDALTHELRVRQEYEEESEALGEPLDGEHDEMTALIEALRSAHRFHLSPSVATVVEDLADYRTIERSRKWLFLPGEPFWVEWAGNGPSSSATRHGVLLSASEEYPDEFPQLGLMTYYTDERNPEGFKGIASVGFAYSFDAEYDLFSQHIGMVSEVFDGDGEDDEAARRDFETSLAPDHPLRDVWHRDVGAFVGAALAFINTPRLVHPIPRDQRKLNVARQKRGAPPLLKFTEVTLRPDRVDVVRTASRTGASGEVSRHHVRGHLRIKQGKIELVTPHWRGNPEKGVTIQRHAVKVEADKGKRWDRDPLPDARPIDPFEEIEGYQTRRSRRARD